MRGTHWFWVPFLSLAGLSLGRSEPPTPAKPPIQDRVDLYGDPLPAGAIARLGTVRFRLQGYTFGLKMAFSPDSKMLVTLGQEENMYFWDAPTGKLLRRIGAAGTSFAFAPDGKTIASGGGEGKRGALLLWETATGKKVRTLRYPDDVFALCLVFSRDGKTLIAGNGDGSLSFWDLKTNKETLRKKLAAYALNILAISHDGTQLAVAHRDLQPGPVYLWKWETAKEPRKLKVAQNYLQDLVFSPDDETLLVSGRRFGLDLLDAASGRPIRRLNLDDGGYVPGAAFSGDGKFLAVANYSDKAAVLLDPVTGKQLRRFAFPGQFGRVAFSPDSRFLAAGSTMGIRVWDVASGRVVGDNGKGHLGHILQIISTPRGNIVATVGEDNILRQWDVKTGNQRLVLGPCSWSTRVAFSPDGKLLAGCGEDNAIRLWDAGTGREIYRLEGHGRFSNGALAFSTNGKRLLSWGYDMYLRVWDVARGKALQEYKLQPKGLDIPKEDPDKGGRGIFEKIRRGEFTPDRGSLVLATSTGLRTFDVATGREQRIQGGDEFYVESMAFCPTGKYLLTGNFRNGRGLVLWHFPTGQSIYRAPLDDFWGEVAFAPDGRSFAASAAGKIIIRETASCKIRATLRDFGGNARTLAFSADGRRLIAGLDDSTALVWDLSNLP